MPGLQEPPQNYTTRNLLFIDVFSADVKELLGPHCITRAQGLSVDEKEEGNSTQPLCLDTQSLKWKKAGKGESGVVWQGVLQSGQMIGIKQLPYKILDEVSSLLFSW